MATDRRSTVTMIDETTVNDYSPAVSFGPALPTLVDVQHARQEADSLRSIRDNLLREIERVRDEHESFRQRVRSMAIEKAAELGWCTPGLNAALIELDLDPTTRRFEVRVTVTATREYTVVVDAESTRDAWEKVDELDEYDLKNLIREREGSWGDVFDGWSHESHDSSTDVEELDD
jgi:hypothetical protein